MKHADQSNARRDHDQRVQRTRAAIIEAFNAIVLRERFDRIQISDITGDAGVGRSTFYEHFRNKEEVLSQAATAVLGALASAVDVVPDEARAAAILRHFQENRKMALHVLCGETGPLMQDRLAELIAERLKSRADVSASGTSIPIPLAAAEIAGAQIGLVRAWLESHPTCEAEMLAASMCRTCAAVVGRSNGPGE